MQSPIYERVWSDVRLHARLRVGQPGLLHIFYAYHKNNVQRGVLLFGLFGPVACDLVCAGSLRSLGRSLPCLVYNSFVCI